METMEDENGVLGQAQSMIHEAFYLARSQGALCMKLKRVLLIKKTFCMHRFI
jgi:hypothetical protein